MTAAVRWTWFGRLLALCVLSLFGGVQTLPGLHHVLVRHAVCLEHGELVHASEAEEKTASPHDAQVAARPSGDERHSHDHCSITGLGSDSGLISRSFAGECLRLERQPAQLLAPFARAQSSLELLDFAPKLAPPV